MFIFMQGCIDRNHPFRVLWQQMHHVQRYISVGNMNLAIAVAVFNDLGSVNKLMSHGCVIVLQVVPLLSPHPHQREVSRHGGHNFDRISYQTQIWHTWNGCCCKNIVPGFCVLPSIILIFDICTCMYVSFPFEKKITSRYQQNKITICFKQQTCIVLKALSSHSDFTGIKSLWRNSPFLL